MPPKKAKKKANTKKALTLPATLEADVNEASSWPVLIDVLRNYLKIPNLSTKSGLKQCYKNIEDISTITKYVVVLLSCWQVLTKLWQQHFRRGKPKDKGRDYRNMGKALL